MKNNKFKIGIIGTGLVGKTILSKLLAANWNVNLSFLHYQNLTFDNQDLFLDFEDGLSHSNIQNRKVNCDTYEEITKSDLIIVAIKKELSNKETTSRFVHAKTNGQEILKIAQKLKSLNYNNLILLASNPVESLTQLMQTVLNIAPYKVFGCGTYLDSMRLQIEIAHHFNLHSDQIEAYFLGEHSEEALPFLSQINALYSQIDNNLDLLNKIAKSSLIKRVKKILKSQGATAQGIANEAHQIVEAIVFNTNKILPLCCHLTHQYNLKTPLYADTFAKLNQKGVAQVYQANLNQDETKQMQEVLESVAKKWKYIQNTFIN